MALTKIDGAGVGTLDSLTTSGTTSLDGAVTINESGASVDFRVESDTDANALVVDASGNRVGIGVAAPASKLEITAGGNSHGLLRLDESDAANLAGYMQFDSNGTNKANVQNANNAGIHLCVGTGGSITFTNLGYTAANALDDYEEGTWTPDIRNADNPNTFTTEDGTYTKIGNRVCVTFRNDSGNTGGGGSVQIRNLPFSHDGHFSAVGLAVVNGGSLSNRQYNVTANSGTTFHIYNGGSIDSQTFTYVSGFAVYITNS